MADGGLPPIGRRHSKATDPFSGSGQRPLCKRARSRNNSSIRSKGVNPINRLHGAVLRAYDASGKTPSSPRQPGPADVADPAIDGADTECMRLQETLLHTYSATTKPRFPRSRFERSRHGL